MADESDVPPWVLHGVMQAESAGNPNAVGPQTRSGTAKGLMQFTDATAKDEHIDPMDPLQAVDGASHKLKTLYAQQGNWPDALAAYNWGPENVKQHGTGNLPPETRSYVDKIMAGQPQGADAQGAASWLDSIAPAQHANDAAGAGNAASWLDSIAPAKGDAEPAAPQFEPTDAGDPADRDVHDADADFSTQRQRDIARAVPGWLTKLQVTHPNAAKLVGPAVQPFTQPPEQGNATARGIVKGGLGAVGNLEDFGANTVPNFARRMAGAPEKAPEPTVFPTSGDVSKVLDTAGWKDNPAWADYEQGGDTGAQFLIPGAKAVETGAKGSVEAGAKLAHVGRGGAAADTLTSVNKGLTSDLEAAGRPIGPDVPMPAKGQEISGLPGTARGQAASTETVNTKFRQALNDHADTIGNLMERNRARYDQIPPPADVDFTAFKESLEKRARDAGPAEQRTAARNLLNDLNHVGENSEDKFAAYEEIKRQLGKKAKFGDTPGGYDAIASTQAGSAYDLMAGAMKKAHPDYEEWSNLHSRLAELKKPGDARFLGDVGADEGATDHMRLALSSKQNIDKAVAAMGGDTKAFDAMAAQHTVRTIKDMDPNKLATWISDNQPMLNKLPETKRAVQTFQRQLESTVAQRGLAEKLAAQGIHSEARTAAYADDLRDMRTMPITQQAPVLKSVVQRMAKDGLITEVQAEGYVQALQDANAQANSLSKLRSLSKYIGYALTGNYLVSFGGPAAMDAVKAIKALK